MEPLDLASPTAPAAGYPYSHMQAFAIALVVAFSVLAVVACGLRLYSRHIIRGFGLDDWFIIAATLITINQGWTSIVFMRLAHIGVHEWDIPPHVHPEQALFYNYLSVVFYTPVLWLVKLSVLVFLLRLGGSTRGPRVRLAIHCLIALVATTMVAITCAFIFQCAPVDLAWSDRWSARHAAGHCVSVAALTLASAALAIFTDLVVLVVPFVIFLDIRINKRARNALIGVFFLGIVVTILSAVRLHTMYKFFYVPNDDTSYSIGFVLNVVESDMAIAAASIPALWPLARRWFPGMDDALGLNRAHEPDIEVQAAEGSGDAALSTTRAKVTWHRTSTLRAASEPRPSASSPKTAAREEGSRDGLVSPLPSPMEKEQGTTAAESSHYFSNFAQVTESGVRMEDESPPEVSYHDVIAVRGHNGP